MKPKRHLLFLLILFAASAAAQTQRSVSFRPQVSGRSAVRNTVSVGNARAAGEWEAAKTGFVQGDSIGVFATTYTGAGAWAAIPYGQFLNNVKVACYASGWRYDELKEWQTGDMLAVFAYSPYDATIGVKSASGQAGVPVIACRPATDVRRQQDLLYASEQAVTDLSAPVELRFGHTLAQLKFRANKQGGFAGKVVITKIQLADIEYVAGEFDFSTRKWTGTLKSSDAGSGCPEVTIGADSYRVVCEADDLPEVELRESPGDTGASDGTLQEVVGDTARHGFFVIPQEQVRGSILVYFSVDGVNRPLPQIIPVENQTWLVGKTYVYNFQVKVPDSN